MSVGELVANEPNAMTDGPFGSKLKTEHYTAIGPRVVRLQNIGDAVFNDAYAHISDEHFKSLQKHRVYKGDIIIAALGETLPRSCIVPESLGPAIVKADCIRFKPKPEHSAKYLNYALNWEGTRKRTKEIVHGVGRPRLNLKEIKSILLPVAPPEEQTDIVEEIETQLSRLEAGVSALKRAQANLKRYRAAVLKAACEGRLVPTEAELARAEGRDYETGSQLLDYILTERRRVHGGKGKYKEPERTHKHLGTVEGWARASISELSTKVVDGTHHTPAYQRNGVPFISVKDVRNGRIYFDDCKFITQEAHEELSKRCNPEAGDILITKSGTIGRIAVVKSEEPFSLFVSVALIKPVPDVLPSSFFCMALQYYIGSINIAQDIKGGLLKNLHLEDLRLVVLPIPPLAEQERIVAEVERRLSLVDELEATIIANLRRATRLRQSVLRTVFSGEPKKDLYLEFSR